MKKLSSVLIAALALSACGKKYNAMDGVTPNPAPQVISASSSTDASSETSLALASDLTLRMKSAKTKAAIDFNSTQGLFIGSHADVYSVMKKMKVAPLEKSFNDWLNKTVIDDNTDLLSFKEALETEILNRRKDHKSPKYNLAARTMLHVQRQNRLNAQAGTDLLLIRARMNARSSESFSKQRPVVIFQKGHISPGMLVHAYDGWHLYGIETTAAGKGIIYFGNSKEINQAIRILDAEYYVVLRALERLMKDPAGTAEQALALTADRYDFPREKWEALIHPLLGDIKPGKKQVSTNDPLALSFGKPEASSGDKNRLQIDYRTDAAATLYIAPEKLPQQAPLEIQRLDNTK